jgi:hypothetical protein
MEEVTVCAECKYAKLDGPIWYSQFCTHEEIPKEFNYVTGEMVYPHGQKYYYCRDMNNRGECPYFKKKRMSRW